MKQKDSSNKRLNTRLASLVMLSVLSVPWVASAAGNSVVANNMLPGNGKVGTVVAGNIEGGFNGNWAQGNQMNLHQTTQNAIVTWDSFSIGANATVTIRGDHNNFNMLNYVTGSESSQIYGKLNSYVGDKQGGNIYLVNPNGVQIGNSAEINVGSLHIANKKIDNITTWNENTDIANALKQNKAMTNAELMSLGYINANKLVFEGERVVIDMDRLSGLDTNKADALTIVSRPYDGKSVGDNRKYDVVLGSSTPEKAKEWGKYMVFTDVSDNGTGEMDTATSTSWHGTANVGNPDAPDQSVTEFFTYRWIKDGKELEKIGQETGWGMGDHYALRYSIDLTGSDQTPIGSTADNAFKGKFDGLDNSIFGLSINNSKNSKGDATGLFGFTDGAIMGNVTLIAGSDSVSIQGGDTDTGAFIGHAVNTTVKGVNSTLKVSGKNNVGGIIGYAEDNRSLTYNFADDAGSGQPDSRSSEMSSLTNTGNVSGVTNVGGLIGYMNGGKLSTDEENRAQYKGSYNLGKITGIDKGTNYSSNIGGLIGKAENATIDGSAHTLINYNTVEGGYNVGGIVGSISNTTVANASNEGTVKANAYTIDSYIYHTDYASWKNHGTDMHEAEVRAANVGGIVGSSAGSELKDVTNKADVSSALVKKSTNKDNPSGFDHYAAGNVGGIVGRAEDSNITNANNVESNIRGAMNVGGIAGYFGSTDATNTNKKDYRILNAINNGGDIMATGGIKSDGNTFTYEITRNDYNSTNNEKYITGNIGGIAGYLFGASVRIEAGGNRGDVHTDADTSKRTAQAANVGGIVGKIDMLKATDSNGNVLTDKERLDIIKSDASAAGNSGYANAVVSSSYNTGNVTGYTNIGGIGGFAYNGSIAASYNVGDIHTTRINASGTTPINMGGILGDSTEQASGRVIIYDTYNKGTIGDSSYNTYGRHVGGIVGRLSGIVEKSYNNGDIYNGYNVVGGIAGYWYSGYLKNVFNTGNITVYNKNNTDSQVGGIVGSVDLNGGNKSSGKIDAMSIANAYNLGSLRSFKGSSGTNVVGGILGATYNWSSSFNPGSNHKLNISNAYTMGNLYVDSYFVGDIVGAFPKYTRSNVTFKNVYYIRPQENNGYIDITKPPSNIYKLTPQKNAKVINYNELTDMSKWGDFEFSTKKDGKIEGATDDNWRMSNGASLPILNAFLSGSHKYFSDDNNWQAFMKDNDGANVQYGTAYDPLLTIITTQKDLSFNWSDMDLKNNGSLAVFGLHDDGTNLNYTPGLTLNNVEITNSTHIFGGTIYSDGLLELNAKDNLKNGLRFGMDSKLYGSDVVLTTNSSMQLSGSVIATGNHNALSHFNPEKEIQHGININAGDLTVYGKLITRGKEGEGTEVIVPGINYGYGDSLALDKDKVADKTQAMTSQGMTHAYKLNTKTAKTGDITISTMENTLDDGTHMSGSANLLYGNYKKGKLETKGNLTVSSSGDILVDSDLNIAGSINLGAAEVPDDPSRIYVNDITLDLSNIGGELTGNDKVKALHKFIDAHTTEETGIYGNNNRQYTDGSPMKITFDFWDDNYEVGGVTGNLKFDKNDLNENGTTVKMADKLKNLYVESADNIYKGSNIHNIIYTWISNANELNSLQRVAEKLTDRDTLSYNYVLKNDIDASGLVKSTYNTIGSGATAFTGTFDGDGHTIIGLKANGGLFGKLGSGAVVKNINIASSVFTGKETDASVGAVAAENNGGEISNISGYGNTVKGSGGYIGGLVGKNYGSITDSNDQSTVIAGENTVAGGIAGVNGKPANKEPVFIENVQSNSAVTTDNLATGTYADNLGGIVGKNEQLIENSFGVNINNVSAHGVTGKAGNTKTSGGIVGTNEGIISNAYNESIIHGSENIGGVAGYNVHKETSTMEAGLENIANAVEIIGDAGSKNVGGLVGMQDHATTNQGRNTGAITGCTNVGGMVGYNTADSYLNNLENSPQATITGITNVGGIAGVNEGEISADDQLNLVNSGKIYGWENVGGIAGTNSGKIDNVNSNINLYVIDEETRTALKGSTEIAANAQFFGGVTGENVGIITNATNRARVDAAQASYVGGIVGKNTSDGGKVGQLLGMGNSNEGFVIGKNYVGGVIGKNEVDITGTAEQSVGIVNSGNVIALHGGAGGIIGENSAKINYVIMKNEGEVHGNASIEGSAEENGTGGIIGVNGYKADGTGANISNSSLMNRVNGNVSGVANVGGIIGINHGVITGGRDANNNYYKYQIYNNGTIQAGSYDAKTGTITPVASANIGGLLGNNSGTLTAGYNTGVVDAGQSSNVGGIAGTNSGTLDQVFNSVVTVTKTETGETDADGKKLYNYTYTDGGAISGAGNVGGIVGSNTAEGTLSNAYSTTTVAGTSNVANIVGSNAGHVSNIYGYAENGNTNVNGGTVRNSHIINADGKLENGKDAKKLVSYDFEDKDTIWKLYDKRTNPLLKVFLTKVTVAGDLQNGWVYDATNHLDIPGWIENGKLTTNDANNDAFKAYKNNSSLLQGEDLKNVGTYSSWLWSGQIASGGEAGPNNLGYDFTVDDITITKRVLNVIGNTVNRTYGNLLKDNNYALSIDGFDSFNDAMKEELAGKVTITDSQDTIQNNQDTGIITVGAEKRTDNKGSYTWNAGVKLDNSLIGNYEFIDNGVSSTTTTVHGVSNVLARKVYLNDINANLTYGSSDAINDHINGVVSIKDLASAIVYGDDVKLADGAVVNVKDGSEYAVNKGERNTADVDRYDNSLKIDNAALTGDASKLGNYELVNNATGSIKVDQAEMHVKLNDVERTYGNAALINGTSYGVNRLTGNVNGDNYGAGDVTLGTASDGALTGNSTGKVTNDAGDTYKWNANVVAANDKLQQNYKLVVDDGASVVKQATLQVSLNEVVRTYGNAAITSGSYSASGIEGLVNGDSYDASVITVNKTSDGAIDGVSGSKVTNDAGNYTWSGTLTTDNARLDKNYKLELKGDGVSKVGKATLNVGLSDVYRTYGNATITSGGYSAGNITGLVNGDSYNANDFKVTVNSDGAIAGVTGDRVTNDHGEYTWNGTIEAANAGLNKNYDLVVNANGKSYVDKAILNVSLNDVVRTYGDTSFTDGTGYGIKDHDALVNGDKGTVSLNKDAITDGGLVDNNSKTNNKGDYKWNVGENGIVADGVTNFAKNYDIQVTAGNSKVNAKKIYLNNINASTTYGSKDGLRVDGNVSLQDNSIVYGDQVSLKDGASVSYKADGEYAANKGDRDTADAGTYKADVAVTGAELVGNEHGNYELVNNATGVITVKKATLNVGLNDVVRTYGDTSFTDGTGYGIKDHDALVNGDKGTVSLNKDAITDGGLVDNNSKTNNKGDYKWNVGENSIVAENVANFAKNYDIQVTAGNSKVNAKKIYLNNINASTTYGSKDGLRADGNVSLQENSIVYGDNVSLKDGASVSYKADGEYAANKGDRDTADAGTYKADVAVTGAELVGNELGNYELVNNATGVITVKKATLNVGLNDVVRTYGDTSFTDGTGYGIKDHDALVNGDKGTVSLNKDAITDGGLVDNNSKTNNKGDYKWNVGENSIVAENVANFAKNYDIKVTAGNSKVNAKKIYLNNINASTTYGSKDGLRVDGNVSLQDNSIVYGDKVSLKDGASVSYKADGEYAANKGDRDTADAGTYKADVAVTGAELVGNELGNYELVNNATGVITVKKATLNVGLNDVVRTYGDTSFTDGTGYGIKDHDALVNGDKGTVSLNKDAITDGGLVDNNSKTNNKGDYKWNVGENGIVADGVTNFAKNYDIQVTAGNSKVNAKKIYLNNINASTTYGSKDGLQVDGNVSLQDNSIVYGDQVSLKDGASVSYKADGEYAANKGDRDTADAGTYKADVAVTGAELVGNELGNYELVNNATGVITVKKATLNVSLNDVVRTYGDISFTDGTGYGIKDHDAFVNGDKGTVSLNKDAITDGGLVDNNSKTNNKGDYNWNVGENGIVADGVTNFAKNYDIQVTAGNSKVNAKKIYLNNINASTTYGSKDGLRVDGNVSLQDNSIVYGDQVSLKDGASVSYKADGEYAANKGDRDTADAGTYKADVAVTGAELVGNELGNYELVNNATGVITVKKATLNVGLNDVVRTYGDTSFTDGTGYGIKDHDALVNGDKGTVSLNKDAITDGGLVDNNSKTNNKGDYKWNVGENGIVADGVANFAKNYDIQVTAGNSKVNAKKIYLNNINASTTYGSKDGLKVDGNVSLQDNSIVYGDQVSLKDGASVSYKADGEYAANKGDRDTADAGTYKADVAVTGAELVGNEHGNYELVNNATGVITVKKATLNVGLNDVVRTYGNAKITSGSYSASDVTGLVNGDNYDASAITVNKTSDGAVDNLASGKITIDAGEYIWTGSASTTNESLNKNYNLVVTANGKSTVEKANLVVNLNDISRVYGNLDAKDYSNAYTFGANAGLVNGDNGLVIDAKIDGAIVGGTLANVEKTNNVGRYEWNGTASGVENLNHNYNVTVNNGKSDVTKANLVVNLNDITRVYGNLDAKDYSNAFTFGANAGLVNGDNGLVINANKDGAIAGGTLTNVEKTNNVGSYSWSGSASGVDKLNTNYDVQINAGKSDVTKANLVVNLNDITRVYGNLDAKDYSNAYTFGANAGLVNGDNGLVINANADGAIAEGSVTDVKKTNNVGKYSWSGSASGVDNLEHNYNVTVNNGKSDVTKANLVVNLKDITRVYGNLDAKDYSNAYTFGANAGLVNGDNGLVINANKDGAIAGGTLTNVEKTNNVGSYEWNATASGVENLNTNYDVTVNAGKSDVTKAQLVVNLNDITRVYGNLDAKDYSNAYTFGNNAGLVNGDNGLVINANKDGAIVGGTLTNVEKTNNVGSYEWNGTASGVDKLNTNYDVQINSGKSDVIKANLVVNLNDITRVYGNLDAKDYSNAYTFGANAGLVNGDNGLVINADKDGAIAEGSVSNVKKTNNVGKYSWSGSASGVDNLNTNYDVQINAGKSDVTKANLVVNLNDITRVYGNLDAKDYSNAYTFGANAGLVNGDNGLVINANKDGAIVGGTLTNVEKTNNVGSYEWNGTVSGVDNLNTNYDVTVNAGKSDVTKANLVVNLNDITRVYGNLDAKDYSNAYTFGNNAGLVNGDNGLVINADKDGAIAEGSVTDVKKTSNVGSYSWSGSASGVENLNTNYDVTVNAGKSDVTKAQLVVNLNDITRVYGNLDAKDYSNAYTFGNNAGLVNGDNGLVINANKDGAIAEGSVTDVKKTNNVGKYSWSGSASGVDNLNTNYDVTVNAGKSDVTKAQLVVNLNDITRVYGNLDAKDYSNAYTFGANAGLVNGDNGLVINADKDGAIAGGTLTNVEKTNNVGSYEWNGTASGVENLNHNYNVTVNAGKSDVTKANLVVNLNDITRVYGNLDAKNYINAYTFGNNAGLVNGDNGMVINANKDGAIVGGTLTNVEKTNNVGSYEWNGTVSGVDNLNTNYDVTVNAGKSDVTKANLVVNLNDITRVYGNLDAKDYSNAYTFGANAGLVNGDNGLVINANKDGAIAGGTLTNVEKTNNVGSYSWSGSASGVDKLDHNYNVTVNNGKSDVTKANLVVNLNDITRVYGNLDAKDYSNAYTFGTNAGLVNGDNGLVIKADKDGAIAEGSVTDVKKTNNVGKYSWSGSASGVDNLNTNYNVTVNNGKSDVTKANLVVNLNDITRVYGNLDAKDYSNAYTFGANAGLVNGDNGLVINANADGAIAEGSVTDVKKTKNVGNYEWNGTVSGVENLNTNYDVTVNAGKSDVTKAQLVVNLKDITRVYGNLDAKDYSNAYTFGNNAGLVNGDNGLVINANKDGAIAEGSLTDGKKSNNVGSYEWNGTASGVDNLNTNYDVTVNAGKSDVTKANLVVNLNDITRVYGNLDAKDYSNAYTFGANAGLVNGDNGLVIKADKDGAIAEGSVTDVKKTNNVGKYSWSGSASGVDNLNTNYDVQINAGKSDVTKANLVVNLNDITRVYGNLDAKDYSNAYTFGANAGLVNGDNGLVINANKDGAIAGGTLTNVEKTSNVGKYSWSGSASGVDNLNTNYNVTVNNGKSDVTKANLVVNLNDITRIYGNLDAKDYSNAYTFGANAGLVNGDNGLVIDAKTDGAIVGGTLTNVDKTNNVGSYEWNGTASGVDNLNTNYDVQINAGKSDVTKAKLTFVVDDKTITQGVPAEYTGKANGLTNGDTLAGIGVGGYELDSSVNPLIIGVYEDKIGVLINGSLHLTGSDGLLKNYKVEIDPGTLTVLPSFNPADDYWFGTAPWDKERNLRERKAEFHYVAGGMSL